jgi:tripeptidyl-peptidase II
MDITVHDCRDPNDDPCTSTRLYVLHTVQLTPHSSYRDHAEQKYLSLRPDQTSVVSIPVEASVTCEIDLGRYWSAAGTLKADLKIEFRGVQPVPAVLSFHGGDKFSLVQVQSRLKDETINPSAKLDKWRTPLKPKSEGLISPLGERDVHPWNGKKSYQLILSYEFSLDDQGAFTPVAPALQGVLYESTYESQMMLVYDGEKRYLGCVDAYPQTIAAPKGSVHIKLQVRHDDQKMLDKIKDMTIWIERKLEKEISLAAYATREDLLIGPKRALKKRILRKGSQAAVFFSEPPSSKIPSGCKPGDVLLGSSCYCSGEATLPGDGKRPGGFPVLYTVGPKMEKLPDAEPVAEPKDERTATERIQEAIRDLKVDQLGKLAAAEKDHADFEALLGELEKEYPRHVPLLMAHLKYVDGLKPREGALPKVIGAASKVLAEISQDELALHFGRKLDKDDAEKVKANKEMEKQRNALCETLARQALAYLDMATEDAGSNFDKTLGMLKDWADIDANGKYAFLAIQRDNRAGRHGLALKRINKLLSKANGKDTGGVRPMSRSDLLEARTKIFETLGYGALSKRDEVLRLIASPSAFKLF